MTGSRWPFVLCVALLSACGGNSQPANSAGDEATESQNQPADSSSAATDRESPERVDSGGSEAAEKPSEAASAEPQFTENMSVDEATKAVPRGLERANLDPETLGKPLQDAAVYEPCKPGSNRVKIRVAIWYGKPVGIDVTTTPKNDKLASCIRGRIAELSWEKKVKSLDTIEYSL